MATQPLTLYIAASGPNSWKCVIVLRELGVPYKIETFDYTQLKEKPFVDINPNGKAPAMHDPNTNVTLWESCAINEYLIDQYDTEHKISHSSSPEKHLEKQYVFFQASGQGPYFGQGAWFYNYHAEKLPSAIDRYQQEIRRIVKVLDGILSTRQYLVGDKVTYADLSFFMWNVFIDRCFESESWKIEEYPHFQRWHESMAARDSVKGALKERDDTMAAITQAS